MKALVMQELLGSSFTMTLTKSGLCVSGPVVADALDTVVVGGDTSSAALSEFMKWSSEIEFDVGLWAFS